MNNNSKSKKHLQRANILEAIKEIGDSAQKSFENDLVRPSSREIVSQIFGIPKKHFSGEIMMGEQVVMEEILTGKREDDEKQHQQVRFERTLLAEEEALVDKNKQELQLEFQAICVEIQKIADATPNLVNQISEATRIAPQYPEYYHLHFVHRFLEYLQGFRKHIEDSALWLQTGNKRAQKKFWNNVKSQGGKYLLSGEHYAQRSAA